MELNLNACSIRAIPKYNATKQKWLCVHSVPYTQYAHLVLTTALVATATNIVVVTNVVACVAKTVRDL